jgi:hypothetical protein
MDQTWSVFRELDESAASRVPSGLTITLFIQSIFSVTRPTCLPIRRSQTSALPFVSVLLKTTKGLGCGGKKTARLESLRGTGIRIPPTVDQSNGSFGGSGRTCQSVTPSSAKGGAFVFSFAPSEGFVPCPFPAAAPCADLSTSSMYWTSPRLSFSSGTLISLPSARLRTAFPSATSTSSASILKPPLLEAHSRPRAEKTRRPRTTTSANAA